MGWNNPPIPWSEFERRLSATRRPGGPPPGADGGDSPAWSPRRPGYRAPDSPQTAPVEEGEAVPYAELHAHSNFSFLDGASSPEELVEEAARLRLHGLALTDHDGFYGAVRLAEAAEKNDVRTVFGAELSLGLPAPQNGAADPAGEHLLVLARGQEGYHRLAAAITAAQLAHGAEKGRPVYDLDDLAHRAGGSWVVLTGCRKSSVRAALHREGSDAAGREIDHLIERFGVSSVLVELFDHGLPRDDVHNDALFRLAEDRGLPVVATGSVHYATPDRHPLATALAAVRARRSLDELDPWLPASGAAHLRSGAEMARRFRRFPGAIENTVLAADDLAFPLRTARPRLPRLDVPEGHTPMTWLRALVRQALPHAYPEADEAVHARLERELSVIEAKDFPGYFLIVHDLVRFARDRGILCQGRGSAANSAICYVLGITAVDSIRYDLPFERFLSSLRDEEPDIDVDFDSDRREEVIQYVYERYGRRNAAQVANVITYRPKFAVRDMAKALGFSPGQQDAWSKQVESWGSVATTADHDIPAPVVDLAEKVLRFPRHLGIHSGGMVLTERPVGEVVPIEHARMAGRTVLQWDKDDCAWMGLVKFDLLGLGMLSALNHAFTLIEEVFGRRWSLASLPKEEEGVYDMLCIADSLGVFQVESRAQMATLPRLQPRRFYDLVVEIALIRPGPIQGGAVHPYIRRKLGHEPVTYLHPKLEPVLERTLGVPLFQEQLMQMAMAVGGCSAEDADVLRRAMGSKRGVERIETLQAKLYAGMAQNGIDRETADVIYAKIQAFADFGFAESHSISFALLVYASSWIKLHYPAVFLAALLRAQPMGFYSPQSLVADARRHGVEVLAPDLLRSGVEPGLERHGVAGGSAEPGPAKGTADHGAAGGSGNHGAAYRPGFPIAESGREACLDPDQPSVGPFVREKASPAAEHRRDDGVVVRLGLAAVSGIGRTAAERIVRSRETEGPFCDLYDLARRAGLTAPQLEALAAAGTFDCLGLSRREAMWLAGSAAAERADQLAGSAVVVQPPLFRDPTEAEKLMADLSSLGLSPDDHPVRHVRGVLRARGVLAAADLVTAPSGRRVEIGGVITHRQRPATAAGVTFLNVEDETGLVNVICSVGVWSRYRRVARQAPAMIVRGMLERSPEGVINLVADRLERLPLGVRTVSRDFH